ncbi:hypothetical protein EDD11_004261 [Mortierella claussenii]|nr:hypothetical protein EDD11_004261 [Mortierella claussenii]
MVRSRFTAAELVTSQDNQVGEGEYVDRTDPENEDNWAVNKRMQYPGSNFLTLLYTQLRAGLKRIYKRGMRELAKKLESNKKKRLSPDDINIVIHDHLSAIEDFTRLNSLGSNRRRVVSPTSVKGPMFTFCTTRPAVVSLDE